jgi:MarR family transcriptional regulator, organic hydroperoxide resistance regulator
MTRKEIHLERLLELASRTVAADLAGVLAHEGVSREEWRVLNTLADEQGRSMGDLAGGLGMNHPTLTKLIDRMVSKSWVLRSISTADSRRVLVYISDIGLQVQANLVSPVQRTEQAWHSRLGQRNTRQLRKLLEQLLEQQQVN